MWWPVRSRVRSVRSGRRRPSAPTPSPEPVGTRRPTQRQGRLVLQGGQERWQGPVQLALPVGPVVSAGAVGIDLDGDVELMQPLHAGGVLRVESLLDLLCLPAGRRTVER